VSAANLVVVSNRLPSLEDAGPLVGAKERPPAQPSVGGLVSAMLPALSATPGSLWVGWSGRSVRAGARLRTTRTTRAGVQLLGLDLREDDVDGHYNGFCNGVLWPLLHSFPGRLSVDGEQHRRFVRVNQAFARALASRLGPGDRVWVHDYHLIPLAAELRARGFTGPIGFFLHVPFCGHDVFSLLPWAGELLRQLLAYDVVGFQTEAHTRNYLEAVARELRVDAEAHQRVGAHPIGIDPGPLRAWSQEPQALARSKALRESLSGRKVILGVDRLDYTKGIPERLRAFERLLERHPACRRRVTYVQVSAPSRTKVPEYMRQRREVEELVGRVNGRFGDPDWVPVRYLFRAYSQRELSGYYREADVCLVSPLRDGMNLVAKEFVACQTDDPGVLVLSRFAGAAAELTDALIVNPYDLDATADALARALAMPLKERQARQAASWRVVQRGTAARWAERFIAELTAAGEAPSPRAPAGRPAVVAG
jgi:trehalose 6-phosphate synthase